MCWDFLAAHTSPLFPLLLIFSVMRSSSPLLVFPVHYGQVWVLIWTTLQEPTIIDDCQMHLWILVYLEFCLWPDHDPLCSDWVDTDIMRLSVVIVGGAIYRDTEAYTRTQHQAEKVIIRDTRRRRDHVSKHPNVSTIFELKAKSRLKMTKPQWAPPHMMRDGHIWAYS